MRPALVVLALVAALTGAAMVALGQARGVVVRAAEDAFQHAQQETVEAVAARIDQQIAADPWADVPTLLEADHAWVVSPDGTIGAHPDPHQVGSRPFDAARDDPRLTAMLAAMRGGKHGSTRYDWVVPETAERTLRLASYAPLSMPGYAVATSADRAAAMHGVQGALDRLLLALLAVGVGFAVSAAGMLVLQRQASTREALLLQERLRLAQGAAHADRLALLGGVSASVAHDLRSPLTAIQLIGESLEEEATDPELAPLIHDLGRATAQLKHLADDLMRFSRRSGAGRTEDLVAVVDLALRLCPDATAGGRAVHLALEPAPMAIDSQRLVQVLVNLMSNGAAFGSTLWVGSERVGDRVRMWVDDDGPGVPVDRRDAVFAPFVTGREDGTGLGLFLCRRLVEDAGGTLSVEQAEVGGARFVVELPVA